VIESSTNRDLLETFVRSRTCQRSSECNHTSILQTLALCSWHAFNEQFLVYQWP